MAFIVFGPGVRDSITLERLFNERVVNPLIEMPPGKRVEAVDEEHQRTATKGYPVRREAGQAYSEHEEQEEHTLLYANQAMSAPVTVVRDDQSVADAGRLFAGTDIDYLPVVDATDKPVALVSEKELLRYAVEHRLESLTGAFAAGIGITAAARQPILVSTPDTQLRQLARIMVTQHIGAIPVVGQDGTLVGIVTRHDVLDAAAHNTALELWA